MVAALVAAVDAVTVCAVGSSNDAAASAATPLVMDAAVGERNGTDPVVTVVVAADTAAAIGVSGC